jgi:hypothetical protein
MIWEKLLTDQDGQYVEVQSGRLFNQGLPASMYTPFKYRGFTPNEMDKWTEYWFPVIKTKGFVKANEFGALNVSREDWWLKISFCPVQTINEELKIQTPKGRQTKQLSLRPLQTFSDSVRMNATDTEWTVSIGNKIYYDSKGK